MERRMAHQHSPRFLHIVENARQRIHETNVDEVKAKLDRGEKSAFPIQKHPSFSIAAADTALPWQRTTCRRWDTRTCSPWMVASAAGGKKAIH
jgi:hypothetical protein